MSLSNMMAKANLIHHQPGNEWHTTSSYLSHDGGGEASLEELQDLKRKLTSELQQLKHALSDTSSRLETEKQRVNLVETQIKKDRIGKQDKLKEAA